MHVRKYNRSCLLLFGHFFYFFCVFECFTQDQTTMNILSLKLEKRQYVLGKDVGAIEPALMQHSVDRMQNQALGII